MCAALKSIVSRTETSCRSRLNVQILEARDVPAQWYTLGDTLVVEGYKGVENVISVYRPWNNASGLKLSLGIREDGNVSSSVTQINSSVASITIIGREKDDSLTNYTELPAQLYGFEGHDRLLSGNGTDRIDGGVGNDTLIGGGGGGADKLFGGARNDSLNGGTGNDELRGGADNDVLNGDNNNDKLYGGYGLDTLAGGRGSDMLFGGVDDINYGSIDFPRYSNGKDYFHGGAGSDRLLMDRSDAIKTGGKDRLDARILFTDGEAIEFEGTEHRARSWTDAEVERFDGDFQIAMDRTNNTALLRDGDGPMEFVRVGGRNGAAGAWNDDGRITFPDNWFDNTDAELHHTILHEIGHNFDKENPRWKSFLRISGWVRSYQLLNSLALTLEMAHHPERFQKIEKYGETWFYRTGSEFFGDPDLESDGGSMSYAATHPRDDFAESFAAVLMGTTAQIPLKTSLIDSWLDDISY